MFGQKNPDKFVPRFPRKPRFVFPQPFFWGEIPKEDVRREVFEKK